LPSISRNPLSRQYGFGGVMRFSPGSAKPLQTDRRRFRWGRGIRDQRGPWGHGSGKGEGRLQEGDGRLGVWISERRGFRGGKTGRKAETRAKRPARWQFFLYKKIPC
jgi:hypothetical protein